MIKKLFEKWYQRIELPFLFESSGHRMLKRYCEKAFRKGYEEGRKWNSVLGPDAAPSEPGRGEGESNG